MDIDLAKARVKSLMEEGKFWKVNIVIDFLAYCLPKDDVKELAKYALALKNDSAE